MESDDTASPNRPDVSIAFVGSIASLPVRRSDRASAFTQRLCVRPPRAHRIVSVSNNRPRSRGAPPPGHRSNFRNPASLEVDVDVPDVLRVDLGNSNSKWDLDVRGDSSPPQKFPSPSSEKGNSIPSVQPFDSSVVYEEEDDDEDDDPEEDDDADADDELDAIDLEQEDDSDTIINPKRNELDEFEDNEDDEDVGSSQSKAKTADMDSNDEVPDVADLLQVDGGLLDVNSVLASNNTATEDTTEEEPTPASLLAEEELEAPSEAELQSAAEILTGSGLLSLGNSKKKRSSPVASLTNDANDEKEGDSIASEIGKGKKDGVGSDILFEHDDDDDSQGLELEDEDEVKKEDAGLEGYSDMEEEEEAEFSLTSPTEGSFGRLWELNEDSYVTITEAGQTYAYELDEVDSDDQEMSTLRRGAKGGWGSGLQNDAQNKHPPGSREWIARRSYDLIASATPREMKLWTKRQAIPPNIINELYANDTFESQAIVGMGTLTDSKPKDLAAEDVEPEEDEEERAEFGNDEFLVSNAITIPKSIAQDESSSSGSGNAQARSALERAVKFPCSFKFKVEGSGGEGLIESLSNDVQRVLNMKLARTAFAEEPAGRYTRVVFAVEVSQAKHVTDLYDAFRQNPLVKFSYG